MTKMTKGDTILDVSSFYDSLAGDYDTMTEFQKRFILEKPYYHLIVGRFKIKKVLDAGCGTGFQSLLLAKLGVDVTALDVSGKMLSVLKKHAREFRVKIATLEGNFLNLPASFDGTFDAALCLGNTLPHLLKKEEVRTTFDNFASSTKPNGGVVIQILNYHKILAQRETVQSVRQLENTTITRSYRYEMDRIFFTIETVVEKKGSSNRSTRTVELRPILPDELKEALLSAGFEEIRIYGSMKLERFDPETSKDLVIHARKFEEEHTSN
jgi:glycine/sarcosine N-methyltransferase